MNRAVAQLCGGGAAHGAQVHLDHVCLGRCARAGFGRSRYLKHRRGPGARSVAAAQLLRPVALSPQSAQLSSSHYTAAHVAAAQRRRAIDYVVSRQLAVIKWRGKPVFVKHRSATEIAVRRASAFRNLAVRTVLCAQ